MTRTIKSSIALQHRAQECRCCRRASTSCHRGSWPHAPQLLRGTPVQVSGKWWHMSACQAIMHDVCTVHARCTLWTHEKMLLCSLQRLPKKGTTPQACCISVVTAGTQLQDSMLQLGSQSFSHRKCCYAGPCQQADHSRHTTTTCRGCAVVQISRLVQVCCSYTLAQGSTRCIAMSSSRSTDGSKLYITAVKAAKLLHQPVANAGPANSEPRH